MPLCLSGIKTLNVLTVNYNTIESQSQNEQIYKTGDKGQCTSKMQEAGEPEKCSDNTTNIPNLDSKDDQTVSDNNNSKINCFIPGPNKKLKRKKNPTKIT